MQFARCAEMLTEMAPLLVTIESLFSSSKHLQKLLDDPEEVKDKCARLKVFFEGVKKLKAEMPSFVKEVTFTVADLRKSRGLEVSFETSAAVEKAARDPSAVEKQVITILRFAEAVYELHERSTEAIESRSSLSHMEQQILEGKEVVKELKKVKEDLKAAKTEIRKRDSEIRLKEKAMQRLAQSGQFDQMALKGKKKVVLRMTDRVKDLEKRLKAQEELREQVEANLKTAVSELNEERSIRLQNLHKVDDLVEGEREKLKEAKEEEQRQASTIARLQGEIQELQKQLKQAREDLGRMSASLDKAVRWSDKQGLEIQTLRFDLRKMDVDHETELKNQIKQTEDKTPSALQLIALQRKIVEERTRTQKKAKGGFAGLREPASWAPTKNSLNRTEGTGAKMRVRSIELSIEDCLDELQRLDSAIREGKSRILELDGLIEAVRAEAKENLANLTKLKENKRKGARWYSFDELSSLLYEQKKKVMDQMTHSRSLARLALRVRTKLQAELKRPVSLYRARRKPWQSVQSRAVRERIKKAKRQAASRPKSGTRSRRPQTPGYRSDTDVLLAFVLDQPGGLEAVTAVQALVRGFLSRVRLMRVSAADVERRREQMTQIDTDLGKVVSELMNSQECDERCKVSIKKLSKSHLKEKADLEACQGSVQTGRLTLVNLRRDLANANLDLNREREDQVQQTRKLDELGSFMEVPVQDRYTADCHATAQTLARNINGSHRPPHRHGGRDNEAFGTSHSSVASVRRGVSPSQGGGMLSLNDDWSRSRGDMFASRSLFGQSMRRLLGVEERSPLPTSPEPRGALTLQSPSPLREKQKKKGKKKKKKKSGAHTFSPETMSAFPHGSPGGGFFTPPPPSKSKRGDVFSRLSCPRMASSFLGQGLGLRREETDD